MTRTEWIPLAERGRWLAALEGIEHGFTHRPEYSAATSRVTGHEAGLWHWRHEGGTAVCPVGRRGAPGTGFDIVTPVGFGGFAMAGDTAGLGKDWTRFWRSQGALAAYVQLSPARRPEEWRGVLAELDADLEPSRECWVWDLRVAPESIAAGLHLNHRRSLRAWLASAQPCWDAAELRPAFERIYADFARRQDLGSAYRFTPDALAELAAAPGVLWVGARGDAGNVEAVSIFLHHGRHADLFLVAATPSGREHSRGLYWLAAQRLREAGVECLNLGGGVTDGDSLAQFKRRFGASSRMTLALRQVLDPAGFQHACAEAGVGVDEAAPRFPPWQFA